jgi:sulfofructose kinase
VWVLGSAAWDHVFALDHLPAAGGRATVRSLGRRPGGSTGNVARALASAGHRVHLVAQVGRGELGDALLTHLNSYGMDTSHVLRRDECTSETLIFLDKAGEPTILVIDKACDEAVPVPRTAIADADAVFVGHFGDYEPWLPAALRASRSLVVTAVPPHDGADDWCADVVIGSSADYASAWLDTPYQCLRDRVGNRLQWVVVTRGELGAEAYGPDDVVVAIPALATTPVDTTGAGDCFAAGLMHGLLQGIDITTAGALGALWAAATLNLSQSVPPPWPTLQLGRADRDWWNRLVERRATDGGDVAMTSP